MELVDVTLLAMVIVRMIIAVVAEVLTLVSVVTPLLASVYPKALLAAIKIITKTTTKELFKASRANLHGAS